jgi:hypothetical protein
MDLEKAIRDLLAERDRINGIITQLELMQKHQGTAPPRNQKQRGRKSMSDAERVIVSNRMRQYWESRRKAKESPTPEATS